jgi:predicted dehydrogenase
MREQMTQTTNSINVGLIGYGYAGSTFHAPLIQSVPGLRLSVIGSSQREMLQQKFPGVQICSAKETATHPDVDLVVIATPNESHFPLAVSAMLAGKDVVIDKPFTVTLEEARSLRAISEQQNRLISVFHNRRWESEIQAAKSVLASGVLGDVTHFECHMDRFRPTVRHRWREDAGPGAGLWFDLGSHLIDICVYLFGLPRAVSANFATLRPGGQTEDWAHVQLIYDRLRVVLHASLLASGGVPRSIIHGTQASWVKYGMDTQESHLKSGMSPVDPRFGQDPTPCVIFDGASGTRSEVASPVGNQRMYYVTLRDSILQSLAPPVLVRDAIAVMAILEASFESGRTGHLLPIPLNQREQLEWEL